MTQKSFDMLSQRSRNSLGQGTQKSPNSLFQKNRNFYADELSSNKEI